MTINNKLIPSDENLDKNLALHLQADHQSIDYHPQHKQQAIGYQAPQPQQEIDYQSPQEAIDYHSSK